MMEVDEMLELVVESMSEERPHVSPFIIDVFVDTDNFSVDIQPSLSPYLPSTNPRSLPAAPTSEDIRCHYGRCVL
jgi:hypothetical protein